jgi:sugar lactone lactonase YvrE
MYVDRLADGCLVVSNFGNSLLYRVDVPAMRATVMVNGPAIGMTDMGNCVVDAEGCVWVNEVRGCRVWRFDPDGHPVVVIGDGRAGFQRECTEFTNARFSWIYDIRLGPDGIYVLDSRNFAVRMIDVKERTVTTLAGNGTPGYAGDGGPAGAATFGSDPAARFDGPISLSLDEEGNIFVGDRFNHVVRMIERSGGNISTIAGHRDVGAEEPTDPSEQDPLKASLPKISSMDYHSGRLFVPTNLDAESGELVILTRNSAELGER